MQRRKLIGLALGSLVVALGVAASPAPPSYVAIESTIDKVRTAWNKPGAPPVLNAAGWNSFFDGLRAQLSAYAAAKTEGDRLRALGGLYLMSRQLASYSWAPAVELREALETWLRPRVALAWAERRLQDSIRVLPDTTDPALQANRQRWLAFVDNDLGAAIAAYESAPGIRDRRKALGQLYANLNSLHEENARAAWGPSQSLHAALNDLINLPNLDAAADPNSLHKRLANYVVTTGPVYRKGQVAWVTAGPWIGWGLLASDDGIAFYNQQHYSSRSDIRGFNEQIAADPRGQRATKLYSFSASTADAGIVTATTILRTTGLTALPASSHGINVSIASAPTQGHGLQRGIAALIGMNQQKITQKVYDGAIGQMVSQMVSEAKLESAEQAARKIAETNAQLSRFLVGNNTLLVNNFEVTSLRLRSRPQFALVGGNVQWRGAVDQVGADFPKPVSLRNVASGVSADVHLGSLMTNLTRGYLQTDQAKAIKNLMIVTRKIPPGAPASEGFIVSQNVDFPTFAKAIEDARAANDPKVAALRIKWPGRSPEFSADRNGYLVALVHDFSIEVPAPASAAKGGLTGPAAKVYRLEAPNAEITISFQVTPAEGNVPVRLAGRIEGFDPGPGAEVYAIDDDENKRVSLNAFSRTLILNAFAARMKGQPIDVPLGNLQIPGFALRSVSPLDPSGWMRVVLTPH